MGVTVVNHERTCELTTVCTRSGGRWKTTPAAGPKGPPVSGVASRGQRMERVSTLARTQARRRMGEYEVENND